MNATAKTAARPRLNNLNDLLMLNDSAPLPVTELGVSPADTEYAIMNLSRLEDYPGHPFHLYSGERRQDMIDSIREKGIMHPLIVRETTTGEFQILSGHNRKHCAVEAGLEMAPTIIKRDLSDEDAWAYVIETNLIQRSFSDLLPSEKAAVLYAQHTKMFSQGKRNDIRAELEKLENPNRVTSAEFRRCGGTRETLAAEYGLSPNQVALFLRVYQMVDGLKVRLDKGEFALSPAATLSFLRVEEQISIAKCLDLNGFKVDVSKATVLRNCSESNALNDEQIYLILSGEANPPTVNRTPTVKVSKSLYAKYFTPKQSAKEVQTIVEQALEAYFSSLQEGGV